MCSYQAILEKTWGDKPLLDAVVKPALAEFGTNGGPTVGVSDVTIACNGTPTDGSAAASTFVPDKGLSGERLMQRAVPLARALEA